MMNIATLMARLDPSYRLQTQKLEAEIRAKYDIAQYKNQTDVSIAQYNNQSAMDREHVRGGYDLDKQRTRDSAAMERERFKEDRADSRADKALQAQGDFENIKKETALEVVRLQAENSLTTESIRNQNALDVEVLRGANTMNLAQTEHIYALQRIEEDLQGRLTVSGFEFGALITKTTLDEMNKPRATMLAVMEQRSQLRGRIFEKMVDAAIDIKKMRTQQTLDIEKSEKATELKGVELYLSAVASYVVRLMDNRQEEAAKREIDRLLEQWQSVR